MSFFPIIRPTPRQPALTFPFTDLQVGDHVRVPSGGCALVTSVLRDTRAPHAVACVGVRFGNGVEHRFEGTRWARLEYVPKTF